MVWSACINFSAVGLYQDSWWCKQDRKAMETYLQHDLAFFSDIFYIIEKKRKSREKTVLILFELVVAIWELDDNFYSMEPVTAILELDGSFNSKITRQKKEEKKFGNK